ncbi:hypothetical protein SLA2020_191050 [Shorea laevis]
MLGFGGTQALGSKSNPSAGSFKPSAWVHPSMLGFHLEPSTWVRWNPSADTAPYESPLAALKPNVFPLGSEECFHQVDEDKDGFIDDTELQRALSSDNQSFSLRTVHLLMRLITNSYTTSIGPKEFKSICIELDKWRLFFEKFDKDRNGRIDMEELGDALKNLQLEVYEVGLNLLVDMFDKSGGKNKSIEYDNFIQCCLTFKGLTRKFKEKAEETPGSGATFDHKDFMLMVQPFVIP